MRHWPRIAVTLLPLLFALLHAVGVVRIGVLERLDNIIYDTRLRATMPGTLDDRIVIVDIDEKSLAEVGRWPWGRNRLADLTDELFDRQKIAMLGFDVVFAEADESSGLKRLNELAQKELRDQAGFRRQACASCSPRWTTTRCSPGRWRSARSCWATTSPATATAAPPACCRRR
jgi:adenylate cyclase